MPWLVAVLLQGLLYLTKSFIGRALVALGFSFVTYTGTSTAIGWLKSGAVSALFGLDPSWVQLLAFMKVGVAISIVFSAMLTRLLVTGLNSDTVKRLVMK